LVGRSSDSASGWSSLWIFLEKDVFGGRKVDNGGKKFSKE
jgi:hypothetical protein